MGVGCRHGFGCCEAPAGSTFTNPKLREFLRNGCPARELEAAATRVLCSSERDVQHIHLQGEAQGRRRKEKEEAVDLQDFSVERGLSTQV